MISSKIGLWGGSCAIRLPKAAVATMGFQEGTAVSLEIVEGGILIRPIQKKYALRDLVKQAKGQTAPLVLDDQAIGNEAL